MYVGYYIVYTCMCGIILYTHVCVVLYIYVEGFIPHSLRWFVLYMYIWCNVVYGREGSGTHGVGL